MLLTYPDVLYLSGCCLPISVCDGIRGASAPFSGTSPHFGLLLSGVTPLRWVLHHFGGGVMLANWCMTCRIQPQCRPAVLVADWVAALSARSPARSCSHVAAFQASSPISHVIPLQLLQTLNLRRWNCSVLSDTRKMTVGNYVRLFRQSPVIPFWSRAGPAVARQDGSRFRCEPLPRAGPSDSCRRLPRHDENGGRYLPTPA